MGVENGDTVYHTIPEFSFVDQNGVEFNSDSLNGKVHIAYFFFTACGGICPKMTESMKIVQEKFANHPEVVLLGFTVDPQTDDVNRLRRHGLKHDIDPKRWKLLTGDAQEIYHLAENGYKVSAHKNEQGNYEAGNRIPDNEHIDFVHSERFILVDKEGIIRDYRDGTDKGMVETVLVPHLQHILLSDNRDGESIFH
jgi:protein SCO1/2